MATVLDVQITDLPLGEVYARAEGGEEIVLGRGDGRRFKLVPTEDSVVPKRQAGTLKGLIRLDDSFFDPLSEEELRLWEGG